MMVCPSTRRCCCELFGQPHTILWVDDLCSAKTGWLKWDCADESSEQNATAPLQEFFFVFFVKSPSGVISKAKLDRYLEKVENDPGVIGEAAGLKRSSAQDVVWIVS